VTLVKVQKKKNSWGQIEDALNKLIEMLAFAQQVNTFARYATDGGKNSTSLKKKINIQQSVVYSF